MKLRLLRRLVADWRWKLFDAWYRIRYYRDKANREYFAEVVYVFYDKNDPGRDHFICHPSAWDGEIPSNYLIAEYRITNHTVIAGTSKEGLVSLRDKVRAWLAWHLDEAGRCQMMCEDAIRRIA